jgi:hypothetical protein
VALTEQLACQAGQKPFQADKSPAFPTTCIDLGDQTLQNNTKMYETNVLKYNFVLFLLTGYGFVFSPNRCPGVFPGRLGTCVPAVRVLYLTEFASFAHGGCSSVG